MVLSNAPGPSDPQQQPEQALGAPSGVPREEPGEGAKGWYRRLLPHRDQPGIIQFITYRLADSLPDALLTAIEEEMRTVPPERMEAERRQKIEALLDRGHGSAVLRDPRAAAYIIDNWRHFDGQRYDLIAWVVMPTHVHIMIRPLAGQSLPQLVQSWKSYTGKHLKTLFPQACRGGAFWMREYWDRFIRDEAHFHRAVEYIRQNPVQAGLVQRPEQWPYLGTAGRTLGTPSACSESFESR